MFRFPIAPAAAAAIISSQVALAQPVPLRKEHAGPHRPLGQLATVYGTILTSLPLTQTSFCEIDGKSYRAMIALNICQPSVGNATEFQDRSIGGLVGARRQA
jgi:hypothetical protein